MRTVLAGTMRRMRLATGADGTGYSKRDTRPIISHFAQAMLAKYGALIIGGSGAVRLVRG
jgi:hypothetical protein